MVKVDEQMSNYEINSVVHTHHKVTCIVDVWMLFPSNKVQPIRAVANFQFGLVNNITKAFIMKSNIWQCNVLSVVVCILPGTCASLWNGVSIFIA